MKKTGAGYEPQVGDWIYSDSPGIWRVYRVIHDAQKLRFSLRERQRLDRRRLIFSKRLFDERWKIAFDNELASATFVEALSDEDRRHLEKLIAETPHALLELEAFQPKSIDLRMNLPLNLPPLIAEEDLRSMIQRVFAGIGEGMSNDEILQRIAESELTHFVATNTISNSTLQFLCKDYELRANEYVFREAHLLTVSEAQKH